MSEKYSYYTGDKFILVVQEAIKWISVSDELPDAGAECLVCYERSDCEERDVTVASYDDSDGNCSRWDVSGGLLCFGTVMYWAEMPAGPERAGE